MTTITAAVTSARGAPFTLVQQVHECHDRESRQPQFGIAIPRSIPLVLGRSNAYTPESLWRKLTAKLALG